MIYCEQVDEQARAQSSIMSLLTFITYTSSISTNHIPVDRYFQSELIETRFRAICVEMSTLFHNYYATLPKPPFAQNITF